MKTVSVHSESDETH